LIGLCPEAIQALDVVLSSENGIAILNRRPIPLLQLNTDAPADLERIVNKCLEKDRNLRYQHASDVRTDLQRLRRDYRVGKNRCADDFAARSR
jgi:hypothetical protein